MKFTYVTKKDERGNEIRYRCWYEIFKDEDTGEEVKIKRHEKIKVNGVKVVWYSDSQLRKMTKQQRQSIKIKYK